METERLNVKVCVQDLLDYLNDLGQERVNKLISKDNQQKIKEFLDNLLSWEIVVGGHSYKITNFFRKNGKKKVVDRKVIFKRAIKLKVGDDGLFLLGHQLSIPVNLRGKICFVCMDHNPQNGAYNMYYVLWKDDMWIKCWEWNHQALEGVDELLFVVLRKS